MAQPVPARKVFIRERACTVGNFVGLNAHHIQKAPLRRRLREGGYEITETEHFYLCRRNTAPTTIIAHWFAPTELNADIGYYFMEELKPLDVLHGPQEYGDLFGAIVCSLSPHDPQAALRLYGRNTLRDYWGVLTGSRTHPLSHSPIGIFSRLYERVYAWQSGASFLDAGCSFGFLPLLVAKRYPGLQCVVGIDIQPESFAIMNALAIEQQLHNVHFQQADLLLEEDVSALGTFDTVTLLHVLEHFTAQEARQVLCALLKITTRRLIIAVPFEDGSPEAIYGHKQLFSPETLHKLGTWCLEQWGGGMMHYESCADGLLVLTHP